MVVCQMLQQQRQRELQRLTLTGALASTPNSPMIAQSPNLLSSAMASPLQGVQAGGLFGLQDNNALHKPGVSDAAQCALFPPVDLCTLLCSQLFKTVKMLLSGCRREGRRQERVTFP